MPLPKMMHGRVQQVAQLVGERPGRVGLAVPRGEIAGGDDVLHAGAVTVPKAVGSVAGLPTVVKPLVIP